MTSELTKWYRAAGAKQGSRLLGVLLGIAAVLLLIAVWMAVVTLQRVNADTAEVEHTLEVESAINRLAGYNEQFETGRRGIIIQPSMAFRDVTLTSQRNFNAELGKIDVLIRDNPIQSKRVAMLRTLQSERERQLASLLTQLDDGTRLIRMGNFENDSGVRIVRTIREITSDMIETETALLGERNQSQYDSLVQLYRVSGIAALMLLGVLIAVIAIVLRYNRDLARTQAALHVANEGLEAAVTARTMELIRANEEIQRFAYIVSHDLRSPLVNVLGFTAELDQARRAIRKHLEQVYETHPDLRDDDAWLAVDEELPEALGFIRTSTEKMDRLINSILELSRQGRRRLHAEKLDMDAVVDTVVVSLHQRTEDAGAEIIVKPVPDLESDRVAVEQILSNLAENALKYLSPARPGKITIEGSRALGMVHIDVTDNGRGIAAADHERIFELFRRAGTQDQAGEGIGLANVRALAYRLGGTIQVDSQLDQGSRFRLSLPAKFIVQEPAE